MSEIVQLDEWIRKSVWEEGARLGYPLSLINRIDELLESGTIKAERVKNCDCPRVWHFYRTKRSVEERMARSSIR